MKNFRRCNRNNSKLDYSQFFTEIFCPVGVHHVFLRAPDFYTRSAIGLGTRGGGLEGLYSDPHNRSGGVGGGALCQGERVYH